MGNEAKPFLSKTNPLNISQSEAEHFSLKYLLPHYWPTLLLLLLSFLLSFMPNVIRVILGNIVGKLIFLTNSKRRNIVITNLSLCFKSKSQIQINNLCKAYFIYLGRAFIDMSLLWWRSNSFLQNNCEVFNKDYLDEELSKNKGVILLVAHSVFLDFGGRSLSGYPMISIYKPFRNKLLNWIIGSARSRKVDNIIVYPRDNFSFGKIIKALKKKSIFYYFGDEDLGKDNSVFSKFFDEKKSTLVSISKISELSNCSVLPCINYYCPISKRYITYIGKPLENFPSNDKQKDADTINIALEKIISRDLEQYMWSLRLFQTRPDGKSYPYK
jgi:KDO2-lipid IV(A) lauroyltransferase